MPEIYFFVQVFKSEQAELTKNQFEKTFLCFLRLNEVNGDPCSTFVLSGTASRFNPITILYFETVIQSFYLTHKNIFIHFLAA